MPKSFCSNTGLPGSFTNALSYDEQIQFLINKFNEMAEVINNLKLENDISNTVQYIPQSGFSDLQKQQATKNIRAVSTIANQILNEDEQMNARENINAMEYEAKDEFVKQGGAVIYDENFTEIPPNTNIASITWCTPGNYYCADITGITGFSATMPFEMSVYKVHSNLIRRYFQYDNGRKYVQEVELNPLKFYEILDFGGFNVSYLLQNLTEDQKAQARKNIGAGTGSGSVENAVLYTPQALTDNQKTQARGNIGAGTSNITNTDIENKINDSCVKFTLQNLTETQKEQARNNIGAGSGTTENAVLYTEQSLTSAQKEQARNNIGAGTSNLTNDNIINAINNSCVKFNTQELTVTQKEQARTNIDAGTSNVVVLNATATFTSSGWTTTAPYTQSVTITGLTADDTPIIDFDYSSATTGNYSNLQDNYNKVLRFSSGTNSITAYCYDSVPTIDVKINIKVVK